MIFPGFGSKPAPTPALPAISAPTEMPVPDDALKKNFEKRKNAARRAYSGRLSTIHTNKPTKSTLGGGGKSVDRGGYSQRSGNNAAGAPGTVGV